MNSHNINTETKINFWYSKSKSNFGKKPKQRLKLNFDIKTLHNFDQLSATRTHCFTLHSNKSMHKQTNETSGALLLKHIAFVRICNVYNGSCDGLQLEKEGVVGSK